MWPGDNERHPAIAFRMIAVAGMYVVRYAYEQRSVVYIAVSSEGAATILMSV